MLIKEYNEIFHPIEALYNRGMFKKALEYLDSIPIDSDELNFEKLLLSYGLRSVALLPFPDEQPVTKIWNDLKKLGTTPLHYHHEAYIISLDVAINLKQLNASEELIQQANDFLKSVNQLNNHLRIYYTLIADYLTAIYLIRNKLNYTVGISKLQSLKKEFEDQKLEISIIMTDFWLGFSYYKINEVDSSIKYLNEGHTIAKRNDNPFWKARNLHYLGKAYSDKEQWSLASNVLSEAVALYSSLDEKHLESGAMVDLISVLFQLKDFKKIEQYLRERLELASEFNLVQDYISSSYWLAYLYEYQGQVDQALDSYQETLEYLNEIEYWDEIHRCSAHASYLRQHKYDQLPTHLDWKYEIENSANPKSIVIVCNGNISRSPYIEYWTKKLIREKYPKIQERVTIESMGVLYPNVRMSTLTEKRLLNEGFNPQEVESHTPRYWEDYPKVHENATIFVTVTGEQAQILNFYYPGKAFMLSYIAKGSFENIIDPAVHKADAEELFDRMLDLTKLFVEELNNLLE